MASKIISVNDNIFKLVIHTPSLALEQEGLRNCQQLAGTHSSESTLTQKLFASANIRNFSNMPITQTHISTVSPFSGAAFGLNPDSLDLLQVTEIKNNEMLKNMVPLRKIQPVYYHGYSCSGSRQEATNKPQEILQGPQTIDFTRLRYSQRLIMSEASRIFFRNLNDKKIDVERTAIYEDFMKNNEEWLKYNSEHLFIQEEMTRRGYGHDFRSWPDAFRKMDNPAVDRFMIDNAAEYERFNEQYVYTQFLCHEQELIKAKAARALGIKREVNLAYGIDPSASGDVWALQRDVFDLRYNIGCYLERDNGYNEQNWGNPQYRSGYAFERFLKKRLEYLAQYVDRIYLDHLCGFTNKYNFPAMEKQEGTLDGRHPVKGFFELPLYETDIINNPNCRYSAMPDKDWVIGQMKDKVYDMLKLILDAGLEVGGETLGDPDRMYAVKLAIIKLRGEGYDLPLMHVSIDEQHQANFPFIKNIPPHSELFTTTHDKPTLPQFLYNTRGTDTLWFKPLYLANYLTQFLGFMVSPNKVPVKPEHMTREFGREILLRFAGSTAKTLTIPLQDIMSLMFPDEILARTDLNLNEPGTSCATDNYKQNFSKRFWFLEKLTRDKEVMDVLSRLAARQGSVIDRPIPLQTEGDFYAYAAQKSRGSEIIYFNNSMEKWRLYEHAARYPAILEMLIANTRDTTQEGLVRLPQSLHNLLYDTEKYCLKDLDTNVVYQRYGNLLKEGLYIKLEGRQDHHFVVY
ncbi:MAG: 4-alpha-glucanotransferase [Candidatus Margulisbacteria bacterium]|nr:4-alpha-glucanotransferase [Candidatus Margulisiibacteriota bacterium]